MYIIIVGIDNTGKALANHLIAEGHEVVLVERDDERAKSLAESMDALIIHGDGSNTEILRDAGIERADAAAVLTPDDNTNLTICQILKKFKVPRIVAMVNDTKKKDLYIGLDITAAISPVTALVSYFKNALVQEGSRSVASIANGNAELLEVRFSNHKLDGRKIKDMGLPGGVLIAVVYRNGEVIIASGDTIVKKNDVLTVVTRTDVVKDVLHLLRE
ncbi:Trk system potassium uptake protein TrkA [uncultured archaeon]|nr:Trk system potassium uptake protein TrkA [uncultured archaeon]